MTDLLRDPQTLTELGRRVRAGAASFGWGRAASETYQIYAAVAPLGTLFVLCCSRLVTHRPRRLRQPAKAGLG